MGAIDTLSTDQQLEAIYVGYYGRGADSGGFAFWEQQYAAAIASGQTPGQAIVNIANSFAPQTETTTLYPALLNLSQPLDPNSIIAQNAVTAFVNSVYENVFNRSLASGDTYWVDQILNNQVSLGQAILFIENGAIGDDVTVLDNKIAVASSFTDQTSAAGLGFGTASASYLAEARSVVAGTTDAVSGPGSVAAQEALITTFVQGSGSTFTLTTGIDTTTTGFSSGDGATATAAGSIFDATAGSNALGFSNTLNAGDDLETTGAAIGDTTLNYTAVRPAFGGNPAFASGVTMNGVSTAVINNTSTGLAGFSGNITGLTTVTMAALSQGDVEVGGSGAGLNTALATVNINASHNLSAYFAAAALAAAPSAVINLNGPVSTDVSLTVNGGVTGYSALTVNSAGPGGSTASDLLLDTNATNTATITAAGAEALTISGTALNIDNLHTFTGNGTTPDTGGLNVTFTNPDGLGAVAATGGSGVNTFTFDDTTAGLASFTSASTVDGGTGTSNTLGIQADTGAILLAGVGSNITDIQTIVHTTDGSGQTGPLTADLALMGSATTFDLAGSYDNLVTVSDITNAQTVEFSGTSFAGADLVLSHATPLGGSSVINFEMSASAPTSALTLNELDVATGLVSLNIDSTGAATDNVIFNVSNIDVNVVVTGGTHLTFGSAADPYVFTGTATSGAVIDASGSTGGVDAWLGRESDPNFPNPTQTFIAGTGTNTAHLLNYEATVVDFSKGGTDTVEFHEPRNSGDGLLSNTPATDSSPELYNSVVGWSTAKDTIAIANGAFMNNVNFTDGSGVVPAGASSILDYNTGAIVNASGVHDNWIKIDTGVVATGATALQGFDTALGTGTITVAPAAAGAAFLASFYDTTHSEAVFVTVDASAAHVIAAATTPDVSVVGLIHMSAADYAALGTSSLHFV